jgi:hypothetical protein
MSDMIHMIGESRLEKLLEVIYGLSCLALEVVLDGANEHLIRIAGLLACGDCDSLQLSLWPPLIAFGTPLCALTGDLEWCPPTATGSYLPIALDENSPDHLLTRGMPGGNVEQLLRGLWLIVTKLVHQALGAHAGPECQDDVSVADLGELVALLGETPNVMS